MDRDGFAKGKSLALAFTANAIGQDPCEVVTCSNGPAHADQMRFRSHFFLSNLLANTSARFRVRVGPGTTNHAPHINYISFWENFRHGSSYIHRCFLVNVFFWGNGFIYTAQANYYKTKKKLFLSDLFFLFYYLSPHSFLSDLNFGVRLSIGTGPFFVKIGPGLFWTVIFSDWIGLI